MQGEKGTEKGRDIGIERGRDIGTDRGRERWRVGGEGGDKEKKML